MFFSGGGSNGIKGILKLLIFIELENCLEFCSHCSIYILEYVSFWRMCVCVCVCVWGGSKSLKLLLRGEGAGAIKALIITIGKTLMIKGGGFYNECGI